MRKKRPKKIQNEENEEKERKTTRENRKEKLLKHAVVEKTGSGEKEKGNDQEGRK